MSISSNFLLVAVDVGCKDGVWLLVVAFPFECDCAGAFGLVLCALRPAAFCNLSSSTLLPRMDSNSVCTIFATSHTFATSFRAFMQTLMRSWLALTTDGTDERI